ncbi:Hypothetical protein CINCED_3A015339 [Cinara cedri]|nr:Hypothetical protein CINCED_3A015339 [Cinara cedri]
MKTKKLLDDNSLDSKLPFPKLSNWFYVIIVACMSVLCYSNSYYGAFVFDDSEAVVNNHDVNLKTPLIKIFSHDFWGTRLTNHASHKSYRPLTILSFRFNVWVNNGILSPKAFHLTNIILHAFVSCQFLFVYNLLFNGNAPKTSFLAALMFAVHPVHVEVVSGVVGRADLLSTCISLFVFIIYQKAAKTKQITTMTNFIITLICCILSCMAMLCKEQGLMIMTFCGVYEVIVINKITFHSLMKHVKISKMTKLFKKESSERLFFLVMGFFLILYGRWTVMGSPPVFQQIDNPASFLKSPIERIINYSFIYIINIWILICPVWLCFDWSMGCISLIQLNTFPKDLRMFIVFGFWTILLLVIYKLFFSKNYDKNFDKKQIQMGFLLGLLSFLPASNLMFTVGFVIAERVLYLPSAGFIIIVVLGIRRLCFNSFTQKVVGMFIILLVYMHSVRTYNRSKDWNNELNLFQSALKVCPMNAKVHYNLAKSLADIGKTEEAINCYKHALLLHPNYDQAMNNLANILKDQNELEEARFLLEKAVTIR